MNAKKIASCSGDAISSLPDEILDLILSLLPIRLAASTSILSKIWKNLFPLMIASQHHVKFYESDFLYPNEANKSNGQQNFRAFVDSTLSRNRNPIKKFTLKCQDDVDHFKAHTNQWIKNALERGVSDLNLRFTMPLINKLEKLRKCLLPDIFFTSKTLVKLTLGTGICVGCNPNIDFCLPVLKSLFLYTVWFVEIDFSDFVIRQCPVLEELYIQHSYIKHQWWEGHNLICHPNVKRIKIHYDYPISKRKKMAFNTPNLVYLDYFDRLSNVEYYWANFMDSLVEARLDLVLQYECRPYEYENHFLDL
ncbi:putative F-box/LRR-repeat protein [Cardamine amara subsp. amara]|uniref:F-box/LRR-repeat protein n=1 Tax=Cardamine amara subsp. amara TaxID=228776 RepID=A0ABD0ZZS8_CARAN